MNRKLKSFLLVLLAFIFLYVSFNFLLQAQKVRARSLPEEKTLQKLPPEIVFTTILLGGFRGILVDFLWMRAQKLQEEGKYFELVQLSDWIGLLEPKIPQIWIFNAWNLAYNISVEFPTPEERWNWVYQGIRLLRDRALKYIPHSPEIYRELSWIYFNKISASVDEFSPYYKRTWAKMMQDAMGNITLDEMIRYSSYGVLMKDKEVAKIVDAFQGKGIDIVKNWEKVSRNNFSSLPKDLKIYLKTPAFRKLEAYLRGKTLREKYKLIPEDMKEVEDKYVPLDWRSAAAHALYWIEEGKKKASMGGLEYQRMVYFSLNRLLEAGKIDFRKVGKEEIMITSPDLAVAKVLNKYYENILASVPENLSLGVISSHKDFLQKVILLSYTMHNLSSVKYYFKYLKEKYPGEVGNLTLPAYLSRQFLSTVKEGNESEVYNLLVGMLYQAYWYLGVGESERYVGLESMARIVYNQASLQLPRFRKGLPQFDYLKKAVLEKVLTTFPPAIAKSLRSRLG
ncbi:MAG: hypothetical protein GXO71_06585, partial [Caldiserica bacterium]|nr:hypothetical protein [Caldisericota bacterium]